MITKITDGKKRFLNALESKPVDRPPIWMMRQAGRSLPEYLKLKEGKKFSDLVKNPIIAAEITMQPVRRFDYDAAIVFSDILVIAEMMGIEYKVRDEGGVLVDFDFTKNMVNKLKPKTINQTNNYTPETIRLVKDQLADKKAMIGFAGSPWTLASYMIEKGSSKENVFSRSIIDQEKKTLDQLLSKITETTINYLEAQIEAGADVIQLFDSQGGTLPGSHYWDISAKWMKKIIDALGHKVPFIIFGRGVHHNWNALIETGAKGLSLDWNIKMNEIASILPSNIAVQGNLDPALLTVDPEFAIRATTNILESMSNRDGFIFNLGHGVTPNARIDTISAVAKTVQQFRY